MKCNCDTKFVRKHGKHGNKSVCSLLSMCFIAVVDENQ